MPSAIIVVNAPERLATLGRSSGSMVDESHDPLQCVKQLRQTLAADKLSIGFFLGAGCPCAIRIPRKNGDGDEPLVPDINGLTQIVSDDLSASGDLAASFGSLSSILAQDGINEPNIEVMLSRIRSLRDAAGTGEVRGLTAKNLDDLDQRICQTISKTVARTLPNSKTPYHALARIVSNHRVPPSEIFTTNYDLLTEQALESLQVPFFDGFVGSFRPFFDQQAIEDDTLPERWTLLWKLHGSINWRFDINTKAITRSENLSYGDELLIHPSHRKYDESRRMPYLVMIDRLKTFLRNRRQPVALFVIGHSFSDEHLNATILESLKVNPSAACFALQFGKLSDYPMVAGLADREANLNVLARNEAIIRRHRGKWLARRATDIAALSQAFEFADDDGDGSAAPTEPNSVDGDSDEPRPCSFLLGDFRHFGDFLDEVAGYGMSFGIET